MNRLKHSILALAALLCFTQVNAQKVIGYFASWKNLNEVQWDKITDINYSFVYISSSPDVIHPGLQVFDQSQYNKFDAFLLEARNHPNVKVHVSVGGASDDQHQKFLNNTRTQSEANRLAAGIMSFVNTYNNNTGRYGPNIIDGIDIDWEPGTIANDNEINQNQFTFLMSALRDDIDAAGGALDLSAAVFGYKFQNNFITPASYQYVDYFNIMAYDFAFQGDGWTEHSNGVPSAANNQGTLPAELIPFRPYTNVENLCVDYWSIVKQVPKTKLVLGLPFYGRPQGWTGGSNTSQVNNQYRDYDELVFSNTAANQNLQNGFYYNGKPVIERKTQYALDQNLLGVMIWHITADRESPASQSLLASVDDVIETSGCQKPDLGEEVSVCGVNGGVTLNANLSTNDFSFEWFRNGQSIGTGQTIQATQGGVYTVEAFNSTKQCTSTDAVVVTAEIPDPDVEDVVSLCGDGGIEVNATIPGLSGLSYTWRQGNNTVGSNAAYTIENEGIYTVTIAGANCPDNVVTIEGSETGLSVEDAEVCQTGDQATLNVLSQGGPFSWFRTETSTDVLNVGSSFDVTVNANTDTYYVANAGGSINETFGWPYDPAEAGNFGSTDNPGDYGGDLRMAFTALQPLQIDSVTVHYNGAFAGPNDNVTFTLYDANMNVVETSTVTFTENLRNRAFIQLPVDVAGDYFLGFSAPDPPNGSAWNNGIWTVKRPFGQDFDYPFVVDGIVSINHTVAESESNFGFAIRNWYPGFYDVAISTGQPCPRVPVTATVNDQVCEQASIELDMGGSLVTVDQNDNVQFRALVTEGDFNATGVNFVVVNNDTQAETIVAGVQDGSNPNLYTFDWTAVVGDYTLSAVLSLQGRADIESGVVLLTVRDPLSVVSRNSLQGVEVAPNPVSGQLNISGDEIINEVSILSLDGRVVNESAPFAAKTSIDMSSLNPGTYVVKINKNGAIMTTRVIVE